MCKGPEFRPQHSKNQQRNEGSRCEADSSRSPPPATGGRSPAEAAAVWNLKPPNRERVDRHNSPGPGHSAVAALWTQRLASRNRQACWPVRLLTRLARGESQLTESRSKRLRLRCSRSLPPLPTARHGSYLPWGQSPNPPVAPRALQACPVPSPSSPPLAASAAPLPQGLCTAVPANQGFLELPPISMSPGLLLLLEAVSGHCSQPRPQAWHRLPPSQHTGQSAPALPLPSPPLAVPSPRLLRPGGFHCSDQPLPSGHSPPPAPALSVPSSFLLHCLARSEGRWARGLRSTPWAGPVILRGGRPGCRRVTCPLSGPASLQS